MADQKKKIDPKYLDPKNNKNISEKLRQQNKLNDIIAPQNTISDVSKKILAANINTKPNEKKCAAFCREEGFHILPLRYSVKQGQAQSLPSNLGENVKSIVINNSKYTVEMVDSGYIYQLIVRTSGKKEWFAYKVTPSGYLSIFPIAKAAPVEVPEFACKSAGHNMAASLITVPHNPKDIEKTTYILYSHVALTQRIIKKLESNPEEFYNKGHWQKIEVAAWKGGSQNQKHCLNNKNLKSSISNVNSFGERINLAVKLFDAQPKFYASIALYDAIGITVKLNDYRNEAYIAVDDFLEAKDKRGVTNKRKLDAAERLDTLKESLEKKVQGEISRNQQGNASRIDYIDKKDEFYLNIVDKQIEEAKNAKKYTEVARLERSRQIMIEDHERKMKAQAEYNEHDNKKVEEVKLANLKADWQVCEGNLDFNEAENFKKKASPIIETAQKLANSRAQDHLNWINSESLLDALDVYDDKDLQNGCAFKAHVASMLFGMEGADLASKKLDEWIKKPEFERKNLFIRGLYSNQLEAKAKHNEVKNTATDMTAAGIKTIKALVDFLKKTDSAWDEWARNQDIDLKNPDKNKNTGNRTFKKPERTVMLFVSNLARTVFRAGMGSNAESQFVKAISQKLLFAQMGELASKLEFEHVVYGIKQDASERGVVPKTPEHDKKVTGLLNAKATQEATIKSLDILIDDAQVKSRQVALKLEEIEELGSKGMVNHTNNYHQVRASGILVLIEAINLTNMISTGKYTDNVQKAALAASIFSLTSFALDIFYGLAKGVREVASHSTYSAAGATSTKVAANIQRAGIKWAAGSLSAIAGGITACLDFAKFASLGEKSGIPIGLKILYFTRGVNGAAGAFLGICAALTYIGPLMDYLKRVGGSPRIQGLGAQVFGETAAKYSFKKLTREIVRNVLLRGISWISGIGLILTVIEVAFFIYMEATKLKRWCKHSTFRLDKSDDLMPEKQEVEDYQALFA